MNLTKTILAIVISVVYHSNMTPSRKEIAVSVLAFLICQLFMFPSFSQNTPRQKEENGIVFKLADAPLYIDPIFNGSTDPMVCYNRTTDRWYMYYTSRRSNVPGLNSIESIHGSSIGIAASDDGGATWEYIGDCNIDYRPDENPTYWAPEVIEFEGIYHMYLSYVPGIFKDWNHPRDMVHLTSNDGINWTKRSVLNLSGNRVIDACILQMPDGMWRLWYNNEEDNKSIYYAESPDLFSWTDKGKVPIETVGEGPNVIYWHNKYYMIVDEWKGLSVFSSDDALNWSKQDNYLIAGTPADQDETSITPGEGEREVKVIDGTKGNHADIEISNGRAYMFYFSHIPSLHNMRGTVVYVQELKYNEEGTISCDPLAPCYINLNTN
jgi:hypothetical protein